MADKIASVLLAIVGIVNLLPSVALFDPAKTVRLYGVSLEGESITLLMQHRAVLLSIVGIALLTAAFKPDLRIFAVSLALISKITFIFLVFTTSGHTPEIRQVALIDIGAIALLLVALGIHFYSR
ncbi:MAG: hypothetical protein KF685_11400 [Acidobacteria bacterium]|nr:hypothetical protein [Acidobacteriota bacterium]